MAKLVRPLRPLIWIGASRRDYVRFLERVQDNFGFALFLVQTGQHPLSAKPLKRSGRAVIKLVDDFDGDTYRTVYTVRFFEAVYVLHAFKKKAKRGSRTPQVEIELIRRRLRDAERDYAERYQEKKR